jgi:hypothetical protein
MLYFDDFVDFTSSVSVPFTFSFPQKKIISLNHKGTTYQCYK